MVLHEALGATLMGGSILWDCWILLQCLRSQQGRIEVSLLALVLSWLIWFLGRGMAGKSMATLLLQ